MELPVEEMLSGNEEDIRSASMSELLILKSLQERCALSTDGTSDAP